MDSRSRRKALMQVPRLQGTQEVWPSFVSHAYVDSCTRQPQALGIRSTMCTMRRHETLMQSVVGTIWQLSRWLAACAMRCTCDQCACPAHMARFHQVLLHFWTEDCDVGAQTCASTTTSQSTKQMAILPSAKSGHKYLSSPPNVRPEGEACARSAQSASAPRYKTNNTVQSRVVSSRTPTR